MLSSRGGGGGGRFLKVQKVCINYWAGVQTRFEPFVYFG